MCSEEKTRQISRETEKRIVEHLDTMQAMYEDNMYRSHNGVSQSISHSMDAHTKKLEIMSDRIEEVNKTNKDEHAKIFEHMKKTQPLVDFRNGIISMKSIIIGLATVGVAVATVWGGFTWIINKAVH